MTTADALRSTGQRCDVTPRPAARSGVGQSRTLDAVCGPSGSTATPAIYSPCKAKITGRIANALGIELISAEAARPNANPDALDYIL